MSSLEDIKKQIETLKQNLKLKQNQVRQEKGLITNEDLTKMSVKELRALVSKHKLFKGISRLKKREIIEKIIDTEWFNGQQAPPLPKTPPKALQKIPPKPKQKPPPIPKKEEEKEEVIEGLEELEEEQEPPKLSRKEKRKKILEDDDEPIEDITDETKKTIETEIKLSDGDKRKLISVGHAIINIYTGGNNHPNLPIPQHLVRSALEAQQLSPQHQQEVQQIVNNAPPPPPQPKGIIPPMPPIIDTSGWKGRAKKAPPKELTEAEKKAKKEMEARANHMNALKEAIERRRKKAEGLSA